MDKGEQFEVTEINWAQLGCIHWSSAYAQCDLNSYVHSENKKFSASNNEKQVKNTGKGNWLSWIPLQVGWKSRQQQTF